MRAFSFQPCGSRRAGGAQRIPPSAVSGRLLAGARLRATLSNLSQAAAHGARPGHYAPYGAVLNRALRDGPGYAGHEEDAATGLVYMQQRYYDPESGTFLSTDPVPANSGAGFNRYAYANDNPYRYTDPFGLCAEHYKNGGCEVEIQSGLTGKALASAQQAQKALEGVLNKYDKTINGLANNASISIKNTAGKTLGTITGAELKAVWNGTKFTVTSGKDYGNGGAGGGTGGTWNGSLFAGHSGLNFGAVASYTNAATSRGKAGSVGASTLVFHELGHETHFGQTLLNEYPVQAPDWGNPAFEQNFWARERPTSSAGDAMAGAAGAPFDCSIPGGCQ